MPSANQVFKDFRAITAARAAEKSAALASYRQADQLLRKAKFRTETVATRETEAERITIHDKARLNPLLRKILQKGYIQP